VKRGVPLVRQHEITLRNGSTIRADGAVPDVLWIVEVDHHTWHASRSDASKDKERDRLLHLDRWQIDRVSDDALRLAFSDTVDQLVELYRRRCLAMAVR
jgi:very-short-patch-repair endonuclease